MDIRDLLVRHEKLVHLSDGNKDKAQSRRFSSSTASNRASISESHAEVESLHLHGAALAARQTTFQHQPASQQHPTSYHHTSINSGPLPNHVLHDVRASTPRSAACNLDVLSDAALATQVQPMPPILSNMPDHNPGHHDGLKGFDETVVGYSERPPRQGQSDSMLATAFPPHPPQAGYGDYSMLLDDLSTSPNMLPPNFESDQQFSMWARSPSNMNAKLGSKPPSRFGSLAPDARDTDSGLRSNDDPSRMNLLRVSIMDHNTLKGRVEEFGAVLPSDFVFPSRHTLLRFVEGYISGFHEQLPFLHLPTLSLLDIAPELVLAILAVGAQYRFENNRGYALWYAAKSIALEQVRRRNSSDMHALLPTASSYSPHSTRPSPSASYRHSYASAQSERPATQDTHREL